MAVWPASLPQCTMAPSYSEAPQSQVHRSQMDAGPAKVRRRFTAGTTDIGWANLLDSTQVDTFLAFFEGDIAAGAMPFDMPHPRTGQMVSVMIKGSPPYELSSEGGAYYRLSLSLEVQP